jgi:hypothetical protein
MKMARANLHYIPGQVWHLTHQCYKKEYLLKFSKANSETREGYQVCEEIFIL